MRSFILGTDWWTDCDDCVALRLLLRAHKRNEIRLLGIALNACMEYSVASIDGFMHLEGVKDIPVGIDLNAVDFGGHPKYQERLARSKVRFNRNEDAQDAVRLYRSILSEAMEAVEIIEIGYPQVLAALLETTGDDISPLNGVELVMQKVRKFWVMAGKWDVDGGMENNFCRNDRAIHGAAVFCEKCPVPVTFLGYEVGYSVLSGGKLRENDFLHLALKDHGSENGRHSWDPMLVLLALTGNEAKAGYTIVQGTARVEAQTGANYFAESTDGLHRYVIKAEPDSFYEDMINDNIQ